jgi:hypothetical protein
VKDGLRKGAQRSLGIDPTRLQLEPRRKTQSHIVKDFCSKESTKQRLAAKNPPFTKSPLGPKFEQSSARRPRKNREASP